MDTEHTEHAVKVKAPMRGAWAIESIGKNAHAVAVSRRLQIVVGIIAVLLGVALVCEIAQTREPVYAGKKLSVWLDNESGEGESGEVVRQLGTNAIPTLLGLLRMKDSALKVRLVDFLQDHHVKIKNTPAENWHFRAAYAFGVLGTNAHVAAPVLIKIADAGISLNSRLCALESLGYVGLPTDETVSALSRWATNSDTRIQAMAKTGLVRMDAEAAVREVSGP